VSVEANLYESYFSLKVALFIVDQGPTYLDKPNQASFFNVGKTEVVPTIGIPDLKVASVRVFQEKGFERSRSPRPTKAKVSVWMKGSETKKP
jgi:hypothetical protein